MRGIELEKKRVILQTDFQSEKFFAVRAEVIAQLANNEQSLQLIKDALIDKDVAIRKAALRNVNPVNAGLIPEFEKLLTDSSYEVVELALQKLTALNASKTNEYLNLTKSVEGNLGKHVKVRWLEIAFIYTGKKQFADELVNLTSSSYEFRTRGNAFAALKRMNYFNENLIPNLIDGLMSTNGRLSGPANDLLRYFYTQDQYKKPISTYIASQQWLPFQKAILNSNGY
jgi:aminopeptidase N